MFSLIVAMDKNGTIGEDNSIPWYLPKEMGWFKRATEGKPVVMGRKTWETLKKYGVQPLPNRQNIVVTNNKNYEVPKGVELVTDLEQWYKDNRTRKDEIVVIGGAMLYEWFHDVVKVAYVTTVDVVVEGDTQYNNDFQNFQKLIYEDVSSEALKAQAILYTRK